MSQLVAEKTKPYNPDPLSALYDILKLNYNNLFSLFRSALFSRDEQGIDKIVWSTRFRAARRTSVRRGAKSGAEKAKT